MSSEHGLFLFKTRICLCHGVPTVYSQYHVHAITSFYSPIPGAENGIDAVSFADRNRSPILGSNVELASIAPCCSGDDIIAGNGDVPTELIEVGPLVRAFQRSQTTRLTGNPDMVRLECFGCCELVKAPGWDPPKSLGI